MKHSTDTYGLSVIRAHSAGIGLELLFKRVA
jgi:hypothetical protein